MARVSIESWAMAEGRFHSFKGEMNFTRAEAIGLLTILWFNSQERKTHKCTKEQMLKFIDLPTSEQRDKCFTSLVNNDYLSDEGNNQFLIRGNLKHIKNVMKLRKNASIGGKKSGESRRKIKELKDSKIEASASANRSLLNTIQYNATQLNSTQDNTTQLTLEKEEIPSESSPTGVDHPLKKIWNSNRGKLPECKSLSSNRRRSADARWREHKDEAYWIKVVEKIRDSAFCNGNSNSGWIATFDWFVKPDTHVRAMEGKYEDRDKNGLYLTPELKRSHNNNVKFKMSTGKSIEEFLGGTQERDARPLEPDV